MIMCKKIKMMKTIICFHHFYKTHLPYFFSISVPVFTNWSMQLKLQKIVPTPTSPAKNRKPTSTSTVNQMKLTKPARKRKERIKKMMP